MWVDVNIHRESSIDLSRCEMRTGSLAGTHFRSRWLATSISNVYGLILVGLSAFRSIYDISREAEDIGIIRRILPNIFLRVRAAKNKRLRAKGAKATAQYKSGLRA